VIGDGEIHVEKLGQGTEEALRLAKGKMEDHADRQRGLDCDVRIPALTAGLAAGRSSPGSECSIRKPDSQVATLLQTGLVLSPITDPISRLHVLVLAALRILHRGRLQINGLRFPMNLDQEPCTNAPPAEDERQRELDLAGVEAEDVRYVNAWDAIGDLEDDDDPSLKLGGKWAELLPSIPEGDNYLYHTPRGRGRSLFGWRTRYWHFLLKLSKRLPSWTITAQPGSATGPFHWKNRRLSVREMARLQTFPDDHIFCGKLRSVQRQIGNAVPGVLAAAMGVEIRRQLFGHDVAEAEESLRNLIPVPRLPVPSPETPATVPQKYLDLVHDHEDHPGTGLGPGAQARPVVFGFLSCHGVPLQR